MKKKSKVMMNILTVSAGCITRHYDPSQHTSVMEKKKKNHDALHRRPRRRYWLNMSIHWLQVKYPA